MVTGFSKQGASRPVKYNFLTYAGGTSGGPVVCSSPFGNATQHIRVFSTVAGYISIDQSTSVTIVTSANMPSGLPIPASMVGGEYFITTPGQLLSYCSTSTSSGYVGVTEMA
jgi:hypothetical protein